MNKCEYCLSSGDSIRLEDGQEAFVCKRCWKLLQNPVTALPLIRGNITMSLRGKVPEKDLEKTVNSFMAKISTWKKRTNN